MTAAAADSNSAPPSKNPRIVDGQPTRDVEKSTTTLSVARCAPMWGTSPKDGCVNVTRRMLGRNQGFLAVSCREHFLDTPCIGMSSIFGEPRGALRKGLVIRNGVIVTEAEAASAPAPVAAPAEIQAAVVKCGAGGPSAVSVPAPRVWVKSALSLEERFAVCRSVGEECIQVRVTLRVCWHSSCAFACFVYFEFSCPCSLHRRMNSLPR